MDQQALDAIRHIRLAANRCDGDLTVAKFNEHAGPTRQAVCRHLDSTWNEAKRLAGLDLIREVGADEEALCRDLRRVADIVGETPTYEQYNEYGEYSTGPIRHRLGNGVWNDGLRTCGLEPRKRYDLSAEEARDEVLRVADIVGRTPSMNDIRAHSDHMEITIIRKLDVNTWAEACVKVGLDPNRYTQEHVADEIANTEEIARLYENGMTTQELATKYNCNPNSISYHLKNYGIELREPGMRSVFCDLLGIWVGSKTERDFVLGLNNAGLLEDAEYHPEHVETDDGRWEPDFRVGEWLVECKPGTWGEYSQADIMIACDDPILVYGLERDINALPHDDSIVRVPGEVPDLSDRFA